MSEVEKIKEIGKILEDNQIDYRIGGDFARNLIFSGKGNGNVEIYFPDEAQKRKAEELLKEYFNTSPEELGIEFKTYPLRFKEIELNYPRAYYLTQNLQLLTPVELILFDYLDGNKERAKKEIENLVKGKIYKEYGLPEEWAKLYLEELKSKVKEIEKYKENNLSESIIKELKTQILKTKIRKYLLFFIPSKN